MTPDDFVSLHDPMDSYYMLLISVVELEELQRDILFDGYNFYPKVVYAS